MKTLQFATASALLSTVLYQACFAQSIALFADASCSSCNLSVGVGQTREFQISVVTGGQASIPESVAGGEFRVSGIPTGWQAVVIAQPYVVSVGNPLGNRVAFAITQPQSSTCIPLYAVQLTATSAASDISIRVEEATPSTFGCVLLNLCEPLCDTQICVGGGQMFVNSHQNCSVGIAASAWASIKALYR